VKAVFDQSKLAAEACLRSDTLQNVWQTAVMSGVGSLQSCFLDVVEFRRRTAINRSDLGASAADTLRPCGIGERIQAPASVGSR
jgi:hypothetical protein